VAAPALGGAAGRLVASFAAGETAAGRLVVVAVGRGLAAVLPEGPPLAVAAAGGFAVVLLLIFGAKSRAEKLERERERERERESSSSNGENLRPLLPRVC